MPSFGSVVWLTIVTVVGFSVWLIQKRINTRETARLKVVADNERERAERGKGSTGSYRKGASGVT